MKFAVIGLGRMGMIHAKNLLALGHNVYGYDPDDARCQKLEAIGGSLIYDPVTDNGATSVKECDAIVISTPT